jgi:hypothetical protein
MRRGGLACVCGSRSRCRFLLAGRANARQQRGADLARTVHTDRCTGDASLLSRLGFALLCVQSRPARTIRTGLLQDRNSDRLQALRQPKWFRDPKWSCHPLYPVSPVCPTLQCLANAASPRTLLQQRLRHTVSRGHVAPLHTTSLALARRHRCSLQQIEHFGMILRILQHRAY